MPERTVVTIDSGITIPEGTEKVIENQHIMLEAKIQCSGTLIFRNCTIEPHSNATEGNIYGIGIETAYSNSKLEIEGCEIIHPGKEFLNAHGSITVKNTSFLLASVYNDVIECWNKPVQFTDCSFAQEDAGTESGTVYRLTYLIGEVAPDFERCTFQNIEGHIYAKTITECSFTDCQCIRCAKIDSSTFQNCVGIEAVFSKDSGRGYIKNCNFCQIEGIVSSKIDIQNCKFQTLRNDETNKAIISIDGYSLAHCSFDDVELSNNSYLIIYSHGSNIEDCQFADCCTDREDSELIIERSVLHDRIREQERKERIEAFKQGGLLKGALKLFGVATRSATQAAAGAAVAVAQEAGDVDKFKKRVETERKKLEREQHKQK